MPLRHWLNAQAPEDLYLPTIAAAELYYGWSILPAGRRKRLSGDLIDRVVGQFEGRIVPFDLMAAVDGLRLGEGTAIGEAVFTGLAMIEAVRQDSDEPVPATIVVLSDGETTQGRPDAEAVDEAREADVPVSTIAFGTEDGIVTVPDGDRVPVPVNAAALEAIAERGGGAFFEALTFDELRNAFGDLGSSVGRTTEPREVGRWFVVVGLLAAGLAALASIRWFARVP